jgi:hypothetical protein
MSALSGAGPMASKCKLECESSVHSSAIRLGVTSFVQSEIINRTTRAMPMQAKMRMPKWMKAENRMASRADGKVG